MIESDLSDSKQLIFDQLHSAQHEINNLRLLNVCLQSTLLRVQSQLIDSIPDDDIKRNETKEKLASLRQADDQSRRIIHQQQISFFHYLRNLVENKQDKPIKSISLVKYEKQIEILLEMFHELNTLIHTEHNDRISQLYITLAQTSQSVIKTREILQQTIHAHRLIEKRKFDRRIFFILLALTFVFIIIFLIYLSLRIR